MKSPKEAIAEFESLANPRIYSSVRAVKMIWPRPQGCSTPCCPDGLLLEYYHNTEQNKALRIQFFDICKLCLPMDAYRGEPELYTGMQAIGRIEIRDVSDRQLSGISFMWKAKNSTTMISISIAPTSTLKSLRLKIEPVTAIAFPRMLHQFEPKG